MTPKYHEGQKVRVHCGCGNCVDIPETFIVSVINRLPGMVGALHRAVGAPAKVWYLVDGNDSLLPENWLYPLDDDDQREPGLQQLIDNLDHYRETIKTPETALA